MPCRAFIDSNSLFNFTSDSLWKLVLMPCRAFIDSNRLHSHFARPKHGRSLNALSGIYWFKLILLGLGVSSKSLCLNALSGIYWFKPDPRNYTEVQHPGVLMPCRAFIDSNPPPRRVARGVGSKGLNALSGIYWFKQSSLLSISTLMMWVLMPCRAFIDSNQAPETARKIL